MNGRRPFPRRREDDSFPDVSELRRDSAPEVGCDSAPESSERWCRRKCMRGVIFCSSGSGGGLSGGEGSASSGGKSVAGGLLLLATNHMSPLIWWSFFDISFSSWETFFSRAAFSAVSCSHWRLRAASISRSCSAVAEPRSRVGVSPPSFSTDSRFASVLRSLGTVDCDNGEPVILETEPTVPARDRLLVDRGTVAGLADLDPDDEPGGVGVGADGRGIEGGLFGLSEADAASCCRMRKRCWAE